MSGTNLYPTIDSMNVEDVIKYFKEKRNIILIQKDICSCNCPIQMEESGEGKNLCMKCGKPFNIKRESFRDGMIKFGETS